MLVNCKESSFSGWGLYLSRLTPFDKSFFDSLLESGVTNISGVPSHEMLKRVGLAKRHFPQLRFLTQAGGKMDPELKKYFYEYAVSHDAEFLLCTVRRSLQEWRMCLEFSANNWRLSE